MHCTSTFCGQAIWTRAATLWWRVSNGPEWWFLSCYYKLSYFDFSSQNPFMAHEIFFKGPKWHIWKNLLFFLYNSISNWSCCWLSRVYSKRDTVSLSVSSPYMKPHLEKLIIRKQSMDAVRIKLTCKTFA